MKFLQVKMLLFALAWFLIGGVATPGLMAQARTGILCANISATNCVEAWSGADVQMYSDEGSSQVLLLDGATGDIDTEGDLDFNGDIEIGGVQTGDMNEFGASTVSVTTTTHLLELLDTTPVMSDATNVMTALNIDLGIGNSTGGTNSVYGILIDDIAQDASNTETAIGLGGSGWDVGFDAGTNTIVNIGAAGTDFSSTGGLTLAKGLTVSDGDVVVADDLRATAQSGIVVTTAAFTPTGTYQPISAGGAVTPTITMGTAGDLLVLINTSAQAILIQDTGTTMLTGDITLNQYDSLTLWCDGTNWIMIGTSNN